MVVVVVVIVVAAFPLAITPASAPVGQGQGKQRGEKCWWQERKEPAHCCTQVVFKAPVTYLENSFTLCPFFLHPRFRNFFFSIFLLVHLLSNGGWVLAEKLCGCHLRRWMLPSQADVGHAAKTDIYNFQLLHLTPKGIIHRWLWEQLWQGKYTMNIGIGSWSQKINPLHLPILIWKVRRNQPKCLWFLYCYTREFFYIHFTNLSSTSASPPVVLLVNPGYLGACLGIGSWSVSESWLPAWSLSLGGAVPPTLGVDRWH